EAYEIITVMPVETPNRTVAADYYVAGPAFGPISGNALTNDSDPEGNGVSVTPKLDTVIGKGSIVINADGSFVFTPNPSYDG
ncbi:Ig-like domain-containing protein, partial [Streptococcus pneumoniae]|uniref:Ig-like domain-containing protein n=1 Tax=Streptococcus pneumoniae TaxID=1313 RepID=UPI0018B04298